MHDTFINIHRDSSGEVVKAELLSGFACLEHEATLLDVFDVWSGANSGRYVGTAQAEEDDTFDVDGESVTIKGRRPVAELIASWVANPPAEPTKEVALQIAYDRHVDMEIDIARGK